jgi:drug/metabolite transporter (DMT)-like permease
MSVVAPITAVLAALVPVAWGFGGGERPSSVAIAGIPIAIAAIALLAWDPRSDGSATVSASAAQVWLALGAGLGFGFFFIGLDAAGDDAGLWPVVAGRVTSVAVLALVTLAAPTARAPSNAVRAGRTPWLIIGCGLLDSGANALFLLATQRGLLTIVSVLGALYPTSTVLLARLFLAERLNRLQLGGCALAAGALVLVTAG